MTTDDRRHALAATLGLLRAVKDRLSAAEADARKEATALYEQGDASVACLPDGTRIGRVSKPRAAVRARVVDEPAFTAWVRDSRPDQVEARITDPAVAAWIAATHPDAVQLTVRPAHTTHLLDGAKRKGAPVTVDGEELPGVEVAPGTEYVTVKLEKNADSLIAHAWRGGALGDVLPSVLFPLDPGDVEDQDHDEGAGQ